MGNSLIFPLPDDTSQGTKLARWVSRWRKGGIESYSAGASIRTRQRGDGRFAISQERIWLNALPDVFAGFRIVQISDIHHGLFLPQEWLQDAVRQANSLRPDVIALTGDFVTYSRTNIEPAAKLLGGLRARYGVYAVLGNHDFRVDAAAVTAALRRRRIQVLRNCHTSLRFGNESLYLAGVDDYGYGADLRLALRGIPQGAATVLLAHNPRTITRAARYDVSLMLSGHTHGGQVNLPVLGCVYGRTPEQLRYKVGWDRLGNTQIYVSRGLGTIVLPWRLRCPAEIASLELLPGAPDAARPAAAD